MLPQGSISSKIMYWDTILVTRYLLEARIKPLYVIQYMMINRISYNKVLVNLEYTCGIICTSVRSLK